MITAATATRNMSGNVDLDVESHPVVFALNINLPAIGNRIATAIRAITIPITSAVSPDTPPSMARLELSLMCPLASLCTLKTNYIHAPMTGMS